MKVIMKTGLSQGGELGEESSMLKQQNMEDAIYERVKAFSKSKKMTDYVEISKK